jgi:hypothetical protein
MDTTHNCFELEALTVVTMKSTTLWVAVPCKLEEARRFGGTYRLHHNGRGMSQVRNQE